MKCSLDDSSHNARIHFSVYLCNPKIHKRIRSCRKSNSEKCNFVKREKVIQSLTKKNREVTDGYPSKLVWTWYMFDFNNQILV